MYLTELVRRPEGKTLEFKRDLSSPAGLLRTVVAFANTAGGTILIGVADRTRDMLGVSDPLRMEERAAKLIRDSIEPRLLPDLEVLSYRDWQLLALRVHPSASRPHFIKRSGRRGGTYVRVGSTNRQADVHLIAEMRRFSLGESFDEWPIPEANSEVLDFRQASESFAPVRRLRRPHLQALRLLTRHQGRLVPTVGGMLLFGRDRLDRFPDAWIHASRFAGTDKATILDHERLETHPVQAIEEAVAFVEKHSMRGAAIGRVRRWHHRSLPPAAVREAIVNAVVHADYSQRGAPIRVAVFDDRLEVESPGLLPFGLTLDDLPLGVSKVRNRVLARVFQALGLVEQWGSGVQRMTAACRDEGLPAPVWEEIGFGVRVTLRTEVIRPSNIDPKDGTILALLEDGEGRGTRELAEAIGLSTRSTRTRLARLVKRGLVREVGTGPNDPRRVYIKPHGLPA
ncbi:MAG: helix-turn-helix domain-containing protein [Gemmatimonadota bacterium]|nr:helix-turn-helix domain-containing protein [Gemmatimonadota bacterium]MDE2871895.1 helix-turn-helix domain-containing protein [Gemmatimonadota bacterium]